MAMHNRAFCIVLCRLQRGFCIIWAFFVCYVLRLLVFVLWHSAGIIFYQEVSPMTLSSPSPLAPLGVGRRMVNLSEGINRPGLPVMVFTDEFQALMSKPVVAGQTHEAAEVIL